MDGSLYAGFNVYFTVIIFNRLVIFTALVINKSEVVIPVENSE